MVQGRLFVQTAGDDLSNRCRLPWLSCASKLEGSRWEAVHPTEHGEQLFRHWI